MRIVLTVIFILIVTKSGAGYKLSALFIFIVASLTDYWDGRLARQRHLITGFGTLLDPIADKFLMLSAFFIFMQMHFIEAWMFMVIAAREIIVTVWRLMMMRQKKILAAESLGKYKTVTQIICVCFILLFMIVQESRLMESAAIIEAWSYSIFIVMILTVALTLISGVSFFWNNRGVYVCKYDR